MTAAHEAILVTAYEMIERGEAASPALLGLRVQPAMTTEEVMLNAGHLVREGYFGTLDDDGVTVYGLTQRGVDYAEAIGARGT